MSPIHYLGDCLGKFTNSLDPSLYASSQNEIDMESHCALEKSQWEKKFRAFAQSLMWF